MIRELWAQQREAPKLGGRRTKKMDETWAMASWGERVFNRALGDKLSARSKEKQLTPVWARPMSIIVSQVPGQR